jgi:hypothetical protein
VNSERIGDFFGEPNPIVSDAKALFALLALQFLDAAHAGLG